MHLRNFSPKFLAVLTAIVLAASARAAVADTINLMWDANPEPQVTGYIVYIGTQPGTYTQQTDVGLTTGYSFSTAVAGQQYCFAVSAYAAGPLEGPRSSEVCGFSNRPPTLVNPGARTSQLSQATTLQLQGADPDGLAVTYTATGLPAGLTLQASTGFISGAPTTSGSFTVNATVSDGVLTASQTFTWTITSGGDTTAPTVNITNPTTAPTYTTTVTSGTMSGTATDNVGVTQVTWTNNRGGGGTASGTTNWSASVTLQPGENILTVTARDAAGNTATDVLTVTQNSPNSPPTLAAVPNQTSYVGQAVSLQLIGSDPNGTALTYSATGLPPGLSITATTGVIAGAPTTAGTYSVTAQASDGALSASTAFSWTVQAQADTVVPTVTITGPTSAPAHTTTGTTLALSGTASDNVGVLQVTWANNRGGSGTATGTAAWSVGSVTLQTGTNVVTVTARDAAGNTASDVLTVSVNGAPALTNPGSPSALLAAATSLQLAGSDPNGDALTYSATGLPPGLALTASNGLIAGTPLMTGSYPVTATVSDGTVTASQTFTWVVAPNPAASTGMIRLTWDANTEPGIAGYFVHAGVQPGVYAQKLDAGTTTSYLFANALSGQQYCFAVSAYLAGPVEGQLSAEVCGRANSAPTLANVSDQWATVGEPVTLQLSGSDPEGSALTYSATSLPQGLSVAASTGVISGTPTSAGSYSATATVSDGVLTGSQTFTWTIAPDTTAPVVTITGPTTGATYATAAATLTLSGTANDAVGVTQVSWVNDRGGSGVASGTTTWAVPAIALLSGQNVLTVTARDAAGNATSAVITVTRNTPPTLAIVGNQSTEAGRSASVQLTGSDADGDLLTYGANGLPSGVALTVSTGLLSGTPTEAGTYSVTATVFDGASSASQTFTWTVTADVTAPAVSITAPTTGATYASTATSITLSGTASDSMGVTQVTWSNNRGGSGVATGTTGWNSGAIALQGGINTLTVTARDAAGNSATDVLTVTYSAGDTTAPTVTITAPTTAATYSTTVANGTISGTASDNVGVTQVTWVNDRGGSGTTHGTTNWRTGAITVYSGVNVITVTARDAAGNTATDVLTVVRNTPPTLANVPNQSHSVGQAVSLQLVASDVEGDVLTYSAVGLPPGLAINASTGRITGTPTTRGTYQVTVGVQDGGPYVTRTFNWSIR